MKNRIKVFIVTLTVILFAGCYDRDIVEYKEFNHSLPKVDNLNYIKDGEVIRLTWQMPSNISDDFKRPLEVSIQVVENNVYRQIVIVENENTFVDILTDTNKKYRFVVKLLGYLTEDAQERGKPERVYSEGQVVEIQ